MVAPNVNFFESVLVLDASTAINLLGSNKGSLILQAINADIFIEETTLAEVQKTSYAVDNEYNNLNGLIKYGGLKITTMPDATSRIFWDLVTADTPNDLGDGESAAIALASSFSARVALDDRKARRIISDIFPNLSIISSLELLALPAIKETLGQQEQYDAIYSALINTRMRVLPEYNEWIQTILGPERILNCPSLKRPNFF